MWASRAVALLVLLSASAPAGIVPADLRLVASNRLERRVVAASSRRHRWPGHRRTRGRRRRASGAQGHGRRPPHGWPDRDRRPLSLVDDGADAPEVLDHL